MCIHVDSRPLTRVRARARTTRHPQVPSSRTESCTWPVTQFSFVEPDTVSRGRGVVVSTQCVFQKCHREVAIARSDPALFGSLVPRSSSRIPIALFPFLSLSLEERLVPSRTRQVGRQSNLRIALFKFYGQSREAVALSAGAQIGRMDL